MTKGFLSGENHISNASAFQRNHWSFINNYFFLVVGLFTRECVVRRSVRLSVVRNRWFFGHQSDRRPERLRPGLTRPWLRHKGGSGRLEKVMKFGWWCLLSVWCRRERRKSETALSDIKNDSISSEWLRTHKFMIVGQKIAVAISNFFSWLNISLHHNSFPKSVEKQKFKTFEILAERKKDFKNS